MINLYHGDCMEAMKGMKDNQFDLAIVDPPYGIGAGTMTMGSGKHKFKNGAWDKDIPDAFYFVELFRISKRQIIWGGNYFPLPTSRHWLVWDKMNPNLSFAEGELAWMNEGNNLRIFKHYSARLDDWDGKRHPTQKPVALYKWLLKNYAKDGGKILDTHGGSMSIAIACHDMGYDLDLYEIDKDYYEAGVKRFNQHKAQLTIF